MIFSSWGVCTPACYNASDTYQSRKPCSLLVAYLREIAGPGSLDAPLNLLVTCDPKRGGEHVLGRFTMPETDVYSTCLAVQNLWLAARAEGLGVGWMSIMEPDAVKAILGIPPEIVPVAYLSLGYPVEFAPRPMLAEVGWSRRRVSARMRARSSSKTKGLVR